MFREANTRSVRRWAATAQPTHPTGSSVEHDGEEEVYGDVGDLRHPQVIKAIDSDLALWTPSAS